MVDIILGAIGQQPIAAQGGTVDCKKLIAYLKNSLATAASKLQTAVKYKWHSDSDVHATAGRLLLSLLTKVESGDFNSTMPDIDDPTPPTSIVRDGWENIAQPLSGADAKEDSE